MFSYKFKFEYLYFSTTNATIAAAVIPDVTPNHCPFCLEQPTRNKI